MGLSKHVPLTDGQELHHQLPVFPLAHLQSRQLSGVLSQPLFVLFSTIIALLIYVIIQDRQQREELRILSVQVMNLGKEGEFIAQALQANEERIDKLGDIVERLGDGLLEVTRCVREALDERAESTRDQERVRDEGIEINKDKEILSEREHITDTALEDETASAEARKGDHEEAVEEEDTDNRRAKLMHILAEDEDKSHMERAMTTKVISERGSRKHNIQWNKTHHDETWAKPEWKRLQLLG